MEERPEKGTCPIVARMKNNPYETKTAV